MISNNNNKDLEDLKAGNASSLPSRLIPKHLKKKRIPFPHELSVSTTALTSNLNEPENDQKQHISYSPPYTPMLSESPTKTVSSCSSSKSAGLDRNSEKNSTTSTTSANRRRFLFLFNYLPTTTVESAASSSSSHSSHSNSIVDVKTLQKKDYHYRIPCSVPVIHPNSEIIEKEATRKNTSIINVIQQHQTLSTSKINEVNNLNHENVFSFRKTSIAKICSTFRRSSPAAININEFTTKTKDINDDDENSLNRFKKHRHSDRNTPEIISELVTSHRSSPGKAGDITNIAIDSSSPNGSPQRKTSAAHNATHVVRKKFSAAKIALRKISQSSISGLSNLKNNLESTSQGDSPENEPRNGSLSSLVKRSSKTFKESLKKKKSLGSSLSWDLEQRFRTSSINSRSRIHSDGSGENRVALINYNETSISKLDSKKSRFGRRRKSSTPGFRELYFDHLELEHTCLHCQLGVLHRRNLLQAKLEMAVKLHARRLEPNRPLGSTSTTGSWPRVDEHSPSITNSEVNITSSTPPILNTDSQHRHSMGTPDIIVSSISSDDEYTESVFVDASDEINQKVAVPALIRPTPLKLICGVFTDNRPSPLFSSEISANSSPTYSSSSTSSFKTSTPLPTNESPLELDNILSPLTPISNNNQNTINFFPSSTLPYVQQEIPNNNNENCCHKPLQAMDTLKPPSYVHPTQQNKSFDLLKTSVTPPRSNSIDLSTLKRELELWSISSAENSDLGSDTDYDCNSAINISSLEGDSEGTARTIRSKSHDPSQSPEHFLRRHSRIEHLSELFRKALAKSPVVKRAAAIQEQEHRRISKHRTSRYWLDEKLSPSEHIWIPSSTSHSADTECYIGENDCEKIGCAFSCAACHIVAHSVCLTVLAKMNLTCKTTFRDCAISSSSHRHFKKENSDTQPDLWKHHLVHRWKLEGRCQHCSKSFQQKMFREKEVIAITCSWCKKSYHNKRPCFSMARFDEKCDRGVLHDIILPPNWLLRLSNTRKRRKHHTTINLNSPQNTTQFSNSCTISTLNGETKKTKRKYRTFVVRPLEAHQNDGQSVPTQPLLVFVNPKSGGNKGNKTLHTLCWLLNPRQVFDITSIGPKYGLEMFRKVGPQLRVLVAGGDGTVGWVLSTLDALNWANYPPIALMPLGTGNDLARCLGWGGVFNDEPLSELLTSIINETSITHLDRWRLEVVPNIYQQNLIDSNVEEPLNETVQQTLPLTVMNNYFSIGADAHVALQFHHSRSANPQMLNSRLKNRLAYGGLGTIDLFKRTWKDLSEYISIKCDDVDITPKIREMKLHCILFHNITFYAGGTTPWGSDYGNDDYAKPSCCDGLIEVLGFTTATLAALQMGGKGERIAQCSRIRIVTNKPIPMQVDGEPCLLAPSIIRIVFHSKVPMLKRDKKAISTPNMSQKNYRKCSRSGIDFFNVSPNSLINVPVIVVGKNDYDCYKDSIERLKDTGFELGVLNLEAEVDLNQTRILIHRLLHDHPMLPYEPGKDWRFLDYVSNSEESTFRISRRHEHNQLITDICNLNECIIIIDESFPSISNRSALIGQDLLFSPSKNTSSPQQSALSKRRINETLRIVLSNDSQETHL